MHNDIYKRPGAILLLLNIVVCLLGAQTYAAVTENLPDLGDESAAIISPYQERKLGEEFMRQARRSLAFVDDPELNEYIQNLGKRLVANSDKSGHDFLFFLVDDRNVNAFAVPGGFIGVNTGLLLAVENESELAAVLAHEVAHITQRHIPRMLTEGRRASGQTMAALLAAILLAGSGSGDAGGAALAVTTATVAQRQLNFSRGFEEEADRIGIRILAASGYNPDSMPAFFERLQKANRLNNSDLPEFLRTHPITSRRIAESRNRAEKYQYRNKPNETNFYHVRAKIRALAAKENPADVLATFKNNLERKAHKNIDAERYGYALALLYNRQYDQARAGIERLLRRYPGKPAYIIARAEIELAAGNYDRALAVYERAFKRDPSHLPLARRYASTLLKTHKAGRAKTILKSILRRQPEDPALYLALATAHGETGNRLEAHQALAEYYYLSGEPGTAIEQLQIASRFAGENFYIQSSLEARIKEIKEEIALYRGK